MGVRTLTLCMLTIGLVASLAAAADWTEVVRGNQDRMEVALTIDAGGFIDTPQDYFDKMFRCNAMLDALEARNVRLTTFITKLMLDNYPDNIARFISDGYEFGNHSVNHPHFTSSSYTDSYLLNDQLLAEEGYVREAYDGRTARPWFRFPYGERDARTLGLVRNAGYRSVYWGCGGIDSNAPSVTGTDVKNSVLGANMKKGQVILLHWQGYHTYEVIGEIIDAYRNAGYEFVTLSELLAPTPADGGVIDNSDAAVSLTGSWTTTTLTAGRFGGDYGFARCPGNGSSTATWSSDLPTGEYTVYAWWTSGSNRAADAPYTVYDSAGSSTIRVSQRVNGGVWNSLGTFSFTGGTPAKVVLSDNAGTANQVVVADAIKFVPTTSPPALAPSWTYDIGSPISSSPSVLSGVAYVGADDGSLYAINTSSELPPLRWSVPLGGPVRSRPMVYNNIVYATTTTGAVAAVDTSDGRLVWQVSVGAGELTTPALLGSCLFVGSADGCVYRLDQTDGAITAASPNFGGPIKSMPTVLTADLVWVGTPNGTLSCLSSDLATSRWVIRSGPLPIDAPSTIDWSGPTLVVGSSNSTLLMVNAANGGPACPVYTGSPSLSIDSMLVGGKVTGSAWIDPAASMAYFGTKLGMVYGIELASGLPPAQWPLRVIRSGAFSSAPLLLAGPLGAKYLYIGSDAGKFFAIPAGMPGRYSLYTDPNPLIRFNSPAVTGRTAQDRVIVSTSDGRLLAFPVL